MFRLIKLSQGMYTKVDAKDYDFLNQWKWTFFRDIKYNYTFGYARRCDCSNGKRVFISMHRLLLNTPQELEVDHINHDPLDNRRKNLRNCTHSQNQMNKERKGYSFYKPYNKWRARIMGNFIGYFDTEKEASNAYILKRKELYGQFA